MGDQIPEFNRKAAPADEPGLSGLRSLGLGESRTHLETAIIVLVAVVIIGGAESCCGPSTCRNTSCRNRARSSGRCSPNGRSSGRIFLTTLYELFAGFAIGGAIGFVLAAVITQFPFVEKIVTPYILLLVTTPMLALVPLLILRFGFGSEPRIIAVALASGPMVMINSATGFRRVDLAKIALARSFGANTLQIFTKIRIPMAMPMIIVGLMVGSIFGLADRDRRRNGRRRRRPGQPADLLFGSDPDAAVLRGHSDSRDHRHLHLRLLLLARKEMGQLGGVSATHKVGPIKRND